MVSLETARSLLGPMIHGTFLRWRVERDTLFMCLGLGNSAHARPIIAGLPIQEDIPFNANHTMLPAIWYREGRYATITQNVRKRSLLAHHWGAQVALDFSRGMVREW